VFLIGAGFTHFARMQQFLGSQDVRRFAMRNEISSKQKRSWKMRMDRFQVMQNRQNCSTFTMPALDHSDEIGRGPGVNGGEWFV
jgi:hypothetical protein